MKITLVDESPEYSPYSIQRIHRDLSTGLRSKGHRIHSLRISGLVRKRFPKTGILAAIARYLDKYLLFPLQLLKAQAGCSHDNLFLLIDSNVCAIPPWFWNRPHLVMISDVLAARVAISGSDYLKLPLQQALHSRIIFLSLKKCACIITPSEKVKHEICELLESSHGKVTLSPLGLSSSFENQINRQNCASPPRIPERYFIHVGGNIWYKNRPGVIRIFDAYRKLTGNPISLVLLGEPPDETLWHSIRHSPYSRDIHLLSTVTTDPDLQYAYRHAEALIFPSTFEGFGYPIIEAQACNTPVFTTREASMRDTGGKAAASLPRMPHRKEEQNAWAIECARIIRHHLATGPSRNHLIREGSENVKKYAYAHFIDRYEQACADALRIQT